MRRVLFAVLLLAFAGQGWGANYCVAQNGATVKASATVANAAACTTASDPAGGNGTGAMTPASFNSATFAAGDTVYFSAKGGDITTRLLTVSGGASTANRVVYQGIPDGTAGAYPRLVVPTGQSRSIYMSGVNNVTWDGFSIRTTATDASPKGVELVGACDNVTLSHLAIDMSLASNGSRYAISSSGALTNAVVDNVVATGTSTVNSVYIYGAGSGPVTLSNINNTGTPISVSNIANLTMSNVSQTTSSTVNSIVIASTVSGMFKGDHLTVSGGAVGMYFNGPTFSAGSTLSDVNISGQSAQGVYFINSIPNMTVSRANVIGGTTGHLAANTSALTYDNCYAINGSGYGFWASTNSHHITYRNCLAQNNASDGIGTDPDSAMHDIAYVSCRSTGNGDKTSTANGDGFTHHGASYNITHDYCISDNNTASGFALVGTSSGRVYNCTISNNAGDWSLEGGGKQKQIRGGIYYAVTGNNATTGTSWVGRNNLFIKNYPVDVYLTAGNKGVVSNDYDRYFSIDNTATLDGLASQIPWATYHGSYEPNSTNGDPLIQPDYRPRPNSPLIGAGVNVGLATDFAGNPTRNPPTIGAYEDTSPISTADAWGGSVQMFGFGGAAGTCATPSAADVLHEGFESLAGSSGYEANTGTWLQVVGAGGSIDNQAALPSGAPASSCAKGARYVSPAVDTYSRYNMGATLARTTSTDITVDFYITTATIDAATTADILTWSNSATKATFLGILQLRNNSGTLEWRVRGGAAHTGYFTLTTGAWHTAVIHFDGAVGSCWATMDGGAQQAFSRSDAADAQYLFAGAVSSLGAGETLDLHVGYVGVNTP